MKGAFLLKKMCVFDKFYPFLIKSLLGIPYLFINHFICNTTLLKNYFMYYNVACLR